MLKMVVKVISYSSLCKIYITNCGRTHVSQLTRVYILVAYKKMPCDEQVQYRVAQKFKALRKKLHEKNVHLYTTRERLFTEISSEF